MARTQKTVRANTLAGILRRAREKKGMTPVQLCLASGVSVASIYSIERGATDKPSPSTLKKILAILELDLKKICDVGGYQLVDLQEVTP